MIFASTAPPARFAEFAWTARITIVTWNQDRVVRDGIRHFEVSALYWFFPSSLVNPTI